MKELTDISITIEYIDIDKIIHNPQIIIDKLQETNTLDTLKKYIVTSINDKDGLPEVNNLKLKHITFDRVRNQGKFRISFDIERTYNCSAIESSQSDYIDFDFHLVEDSLEAKAKYFNWDLNN